MEKYYPAEQANYMPRVHIINVLSLATVCIHLSFLFSDFFLIPKLQTKNTLFEYSLYYLCGRERESKEFMVSIEEMDMVCIMLCEKAACIQKKGLWKRK